MKNGRKRDQKERGEGRFLTAPPERRIYPAAAVPLARLPDKSGVPVGSAIRAGGGAEVRPAARGIIERLDSIALARGTM